MNAEHKKILEEFELNLKKSTLSKKSNFFDNEPIISVDTIESTIGWKKGLINDIPYKVAWYNEFKKKISEVQDAIQQQLQLSEQAAMWGIGIIQEKQQSLTKIFSDQKIHLSQSLIQSNLAMNYLSSPMTWDQYFLYSPMFTPKNLSANFLQGIVFNC